MAIVTFAGLGSGFDSGSLITSLINAEKTPETAFKQSQSNLTTQISTLGTLVSKLQALGDAATALNSASAIGAPTAKSGDATRVSATASATAVTGSYQVVVGALASAQTNVSTGYASDTAGVAGTGSFTLGDVHGGAPITISYGAGDSLSAIAARINGDAGASALVSASVLFDGAAYRLVLTAQKSGVTNGVSYGGAGLGFAAPGSEVTAAADASLTINGVAMTRASNTVDDAIKGVTLSLGSLTPPGGAATRIDVAVDSSALEQKAQSIVDAYNGIAKILHGQLDYTGVKLGSDTLFGDSTAQSLQRRLTDAFANAYSYGAGAINASALGISTQSDGTLAISDSKFKAAIAADPLALQHVLVGNGSAGAGLVGALNALVKDYTQYGSGALLGEQASKQSQIKAYDDRISRIENRAAALETSLRSQFAALDGLESSLTSQQSYITSLFPSTTSSH